MAFLNHINGFFNSRGVRKTLLRLRLPIGAALLIWLLCIVDPAWFWWGLGISAFGALCQLWCFACIKTQKALAVSGPYMFVRNPMYLSRFFLVLGGFVWTGNPWAVGVFVVIYYLYMYNRVLREEVILRDVFGESYEAYCRDVKRFFPTLNKRFDPGLLMKLDRECFNRNHGLTNVLVVVALYALAYYCTFIFPYPFQ